MAKMSYAEMPPDELKVFDSLEDVKVVFDVGARDDVEYLKLKPDIELHAFEPHPKFFDQLVKNVGANGKAHLNNYALGESEGEALYNEEKQAFIEGTIPSPHGEYLFQIRTLDDYVKRKEVEQIDFLKVDTEGFEYRVFVGGRNTIPKARS